MKGLNCILLVLDLSSHLSYVQVKYFLEKCIYLEPEFVVIGFIENSKIDKDVLKNAKELCRVMNVKLYFAHDERFKNVDNLILKIAKRLIRNFKQKSRIINEQKSSNCTIQ